MRINFEKDGNTRYAVSTNAEYRGYVHTDLFWAEITEGLGAFRVVWTDAFNAPEFFDTMEEARKHIRANYNLHTPHSQGKVTPIEDEE